jgi:hypothetical protein
MGLKIGIAAMAVAACALAGAARPADASTAWWGTPRDGHRVLVVDTGNESHQITVHAIDYMNNGRERRRLIIRGAGITADGITGITDGGACYKSPTAADTVTCDAWDTPGCSSKEAADVDAIGRRESYCDRKYEDTIGLIMRLGAGDDGVLITRAAARSLYMPEVWGGAGRDTLETQPGRTPVFLLGGNDDDVLIGNKYGKEALWGGPGNDRIIPGGFARDHIDGGDGAFDKDGRPVFRPYVRNDAECAARTQGFWDRALDNDADNRQTINGRSFYRTGVDTLDLGSRSSMGSAPPGVGFLPEFVEHGGALVDLNLCRLGFFADTAKVGLVHAIEIVRGTRFNDRLVGDGSGTTVIGNGGNDWLSAERGGTADARDGEVDTVRCLGAGSKNRNLVDRVDKKLPERTGKACESWKLP